MNVKCIYCEKIIDKPLVWATHRNFRYFDCECCRSTQTFYLDELRYYSFIVDLWEFEFMVREDCFVLWKLYEHHLKKEVLKINYKPNLNPSNALIKLPTLLNFS